MNSDLEGHGFLQAPTEEEYPTVNRKTSIYNPLNTFEVPKEKSYRQQYGDIYYLRLAQLKPAVEAIAAEDWDGFEFRGEQVRRADRVLDVRQGEFCWVVGTVYMDMTLKPNILEDISKDHWIAAPPPREKYVSPDGKDQVMLEDESGRLRMIGMPLSTDLLVTGCIIAVMGTENADGDFEVVAIKVPDLPLQPARWERDEVGKDSTESREGGGKVAIVSGLAFSGNEADNLRSDLLAEYLLGEAANDAETSASQISRLLIVGNSISEAALLPPKTDGENGTATTKKIAAKKYGYDASSYNPEPTTHLDGFLASLLPSIPITLIPGTTDPTNVSLPQQPIHSALLPHSRAYAAAPGTDEAGWFHSATNPAEADVQGFRFLSTGGQPVDDVYKYVHSDDRLEMMERLLRWRCCAPTAPDTLWCYPFQTHDPFTLGPKACPHVFLVGNQPRFDTALVLGPQGQKVRLIALPKFKETGECVLLDFDKLEQGEGVEIVKFDVHE